jgi:hypothetical protein
VGTPRFILGGGNAQDVFAIRPEGEKLVATILATMMRVAKQ